MDRSPCKPCRLAFQGAPARHLNDGGAVANRRHRAFVEIAEGLGRYSVDQACDVFACVLAGLKRNRAELRKDVVGLRIGDPRDVADGEDLRMTTEAEVGLDGDAVAVLERASQFCSDGICLQARAPDDGMRLEDASRRLPAVAGSCSESHPRLPLHLGLDRAKTLVESKKETRVAASLAARVAASSAALRS